MRIKKFDWSDQAKAPFIQAAQKSLKHPLIRMCCGSDQALQTTKRGRQKFRSNRFNEKVTEICGKRSKN